MSDVIYFLKVFIKNEYKIKIPTNTTLLPFPILYYHQVIIQLSFSLS
jgi:hypothetical protein